MSKLDLFLWLSKFLQIDIEKIFKKCQTNESTKKIHLRGKKGKHGTGKQTQIPITLTEGLAATDKG